MVKNYAVSKSFPVNQEKKITKRKDKANEAKRLQILKLRHTMQFLMLLSLILSISLKQTWNQWLNSNCQLYLKFHIIIGKESYFMMPEGKT